MDNRIEEISIHREDKKPFICYNTNKVTYSHTAALSDDIPQWVLLEHRQCPHCTFRRDERTYCPLCLTLYPVLTYFSDVSSTEHIKITIKETLFSTQIELPAQDSLLILLPYLAILSDCPHWRYNRWVYRYFSYASDYKFWVFEALAITLVREFVISDEFPDKNEMLMKVQRRLGTLKITIDSLIMRIKDVLEKDASFNALVAGTHLTTLLEMKMDECIEEWKNEILMNLDPTG